MTRHYLARPREPHTPTVVTRCQAATCGKHPREALPGTTVCHYCEQRAYDNLQALARTWAALDLALTLNTPGGDLGERITGTSSRPAPANLSVIEAREHIGGTLTFWVARIMETAPTLKVPSADPPAQARWVASNLDHLTRKAMDDSWPESICVDARDLARLAHRTAYPDGSRRFTTGVPCRETDCPGHLVTRVTEAMPTIPDLWCTENPKHRVQPSEFRRIARHVKEHTR